MSFKIFWKKKEKEKTPQETTTKLYKRIEKLYTVMEELGLNQSIFLSLFVEKEFESNLGERVFQIEKNYRKCDCSSILDTYYRVIYLETLPRTKSYSKIKITIFDLDVFKNETKIKPCPIALTAHEIDLAILEFENYIDKIYNEHKAKQDELSK